MFILTEEKKSGKRQIKNINNIDKKGKENNSEFLFKFLILIAKPKIKISNNIKKKSIFVLKKK